jgi:hypothetical protein
MAANPEQEAPISFDQLERGLTYWRTRINRVHGMLQGGEMFERGGSKPRAARTTGASTSTPTGAKRKRAPRKQTAAQSTS